MTGRYKPTWSSLATHPTPQWFKDEKFGIYTHWGLYSVAAYGSNGTWYPNQIYREGSKAFNHHVKTYGHPSEFGHKDFIPMFKAEKFDADEWAEIFKSSGARFAGPVAEHHDGFSMWDSKVNSWNAAQMGPKRDIVGELEKSIRKQGMRYVATFHHAFNWWFFPVWDEQYDCGKQENTGFYVRTHERDERPDKEYLDQWRDKVIEVIDAYSPDLLWFDFGLGGIQERYRKEMLARYYNSAEELGKEVVVTFKEIPKGWNHLPPGTGIADLELGKMNELTHYQWITDTSIDAGGTWSHVTNVGFKSTERLIHNLIDRVSKNGQLLLNIGPRADGSIPGPAQAALVGIGRWLEVNGEAIFGTTPWVSSGTGPTAVEGGSHFNEGNEVRFTASDFRFTTKDDAVYAICLGRPGDSVNIETLRPYKSGERTKLDPFKIIYPEDIKSIRMLGSDQNLKWRLDEDGLTMEMPQKIPNDIACAFKIDLYPV